MRELDDSELVARALAGEERAFKEIVVRFERPIYTLILRMVRSSSLAEDLAQETFLKAYRALDRFDPGHRLSSWLFKIAHNTTIDALRRRTPDSVSLDAAGDDERPLAETLEDATSPSPELAAERKDLAAHLEVAMAGMRSEYREVLVLRFQEGFAYEEIAQVMGLPLGTVKTYIHRARKDLALRMSARGWGPREAETEGATGS
ncbi:MAG TPA: sigma-70 family RNA polymerase sigma factor [Thermoanaerobaculia bacterium]|nr:sigma-70 family RNA polymerase sigma factor [Thermoanaerobaculia bacterium]